MTYLCTQKVHPLVGELCGHSKADGGESAVSFNYKRVILRTVVSLLVLFTAETIPHFGAILSLIGGSSTTLPAYVAPPVFYFKLAYSKGP